MKRPLRILHCVASLNDADGGPSRSVPSLAGAVADTGADVRIWSRQSPTIDLADFHRVEFVSGALESAITDDWIPDVIHDHGLWLNSNHSVARLGRHHRIPRFVSPRGMLEPWCLRHRQYRKRVAWQMYQHRDLLSSACLHATSEGEAEQFRRLGFTQPIVLLPNGVRLPEFGSFANFDADSAQSPKREVLFLSRIHPKKGLLNLVRAWKQVACDEWQLRIVGADESGHRREVEKAIIEHALHDCVTVCNPQYSNKKWDLLRNADVMILPSFSENFGIVVAEALAVGTPVITTTGTPWQKVVTEGCGWYVEPTVADLATSLHLAMNTARPDLKAMGKRGQKWVRQEFSWQDIGQKMLTAYDSVLGKITNCPWVEQSKNAA